MKRFLVAFDRTTMSWPRPHSGHGTRPPFGSLVPSMTNFFAAADHDKKPLAS